jgi:D-glycero-alpha-D-manno-heptose-7-phosphate kinase
VVSTTIDKYVYINVNKKFDNWIRLSYSRTEEVETVAEITHPLVRAALQRLEIDGGLEITSIADIPSRGTGLGSSSAFTVGLLLALHAYRSRYISPRDLAEESCTVEIDLCGDPIGKQDQYAAAFGGFNYMRFQPDGSVLVEPILCTTSMRDELQASLITFYTGRTRQASSILTEQNRLAETSPRTQRVLQRMSALANTLRAELNNGHVDALGNILDESWCLKREVHHSITSPEIDDWYAAAKRAGAIGGKLLGAGGGGFLAFFAPPECHCAIERALGLRRIDLAFERSGSRIILYQQPRGERR